MPSTVPTLSQKFRTLADRKRTEADEILALVESEQREMTQEEADRVDALIAEIESLTGKAVKLEATEATPEEPDPRDEPEPRSIRSKPPRQAPAIHTEERTFSLMRALRLSLEKRTPDGVEGEVHQELLKHRSSATPPEGILIPLGNEPELRTLLYGKNVSRRDLTTTTGAGAIFTVAETPFIDLLRNRLVLQELGATFLTGLEGKMGIPRQNAASQAYWVAEGVSVTASNPTLDQVPLVDKTLGALVPFSRKFLYQSSLDVEAWVKKDMAKVLAIALEAAAINGSGSGATPQGILQRSTIVTASAGVQGGANGAVPTFAQVVAMESQVAAANADEGNLKYLTTPGLRGALKTTVKASGQPVYLYEDGEVNGHPCLVSNSVPSNLTKGTSTGNCHAIIYGNWEDLIVATWGGIDTLVNPYTNQANGGVIISMMMEADVAVRHDESFSVVLDAKVA